MDETSIGAMALRVAACGNPDVDPMSELVQLVSDCRSAMASVADGVSEGRLSEESLIRLWALINERARIACEGLRSCKNETEAVLGRSAVMRQTKTIGVPE